MCNFMVIFKKVCLKSQKSESHTSWYTTLRTLNNSSLLDLQVRQQMALLKMLGKVSSKSNPKEKVKYSLMKESIFTILCLQNAFL